MNPDLPKRLVDALFERFVEPSNRLIYSYAMDGRLAALPTAQELGAGIPAEAAWGTGMEDSAMNGGLAVAALTRLGDHEMASILARGILDLSDLSSDPGCVPRSVVPHGSARPKNTSTDQLGLYCHGLLVFCMGNAEPTLRERAARKLLQIARRLERDQWVWKNEGGSPAAGGKLGEPEVEKRIRLMGILASAAKASALLEEMEKGRDSSHRESKAGEALWRTVRSLGAEVDAALGAFTVPPPRTSGWGFYVPEQLQVQLAALGDDLEESASSAISRESGRMGALPPAALDQATRKRLMALLADSTMDAGFPHAGHAPIYSGETEQVLAELARARSALDWRRVDIRLVEMQEDLTWRDEYRRFPPGDKGLGGALDFVLRWMGRRPGFCHERAFVRYPLTAFHVALLAQGSEAARSARDEAEAFFQRVDVAKVSCADTLVEALAVVSLLAPEKPPLR